MNYARTAQVFLGIAISLVLVMVMLFTGFYVPMWVAVGLICIPAFGVATAALFNRLPSVAIGLAIGMAALSALLLYRYTTMGS